MVHVYHLSWPRFLPLTLIWALAMALFALPSLGTPAPSAAEQRVLVLSALAVTLIIAPFFGILWQSRLVLSPEGITHHQFGYRVQSAWGNLQRLDLASGTESLILAEPGTTSRVLRYGVRLYEGVMPSVMSGAFGDPDALAEGRLILLAPFMWHWRRGTLRADIMRWAPHLFDQRPGCMSDQLEPSQTK